MGATTKAPQQRETSTTCGRCDSSVVEERIEGIAGTWWRYRCEGCGQIGKHHSDKDHRRHVREEQRAAERRVRSERGLRGPGVRWYLDRDEQEVGG